MKLKHRLYAILLAVSLIPLFICGFVMVYQNNQNVEHVISDNLQGVSQTQIDNIENFCLHVKQDMEILSQYSFLQNEVLSSLNRVDSEGVTTRNHLAELLKQRRDYQPYIQSMVICDRNLRIVAASEDYSAGENSGLGHVDPAFLTGSFCIGNVYTRETNTGTKRAVLAYQGIYSGEELIGFIIEEILTEHFSAYHEDNVFWENGIMQILDGNHKIVTVGGYGEQNADFIEVQDLHDRNVERMRRKKGYETFGSLEYEINGVKYVTCYSDLDYSDWEIRVSVNMDEYKQVGASYITLFATTAIVGTFLLLVVNYFLTGSTIGPIERIIETLKAVQETGDYSIRVETTTDDEMGELQHEINHLLQQVMEAQLQDKAEQKSLEKKAEKDPMTGVLNKKAIARYVQYMAEEAENHAGKMAVGFVDIDNFRDYNTLYGHAEGDHVIKFVASTLREMIPGMVGRNGGDEFVFCMETDGREIVEQVMERLVHRLNQGVINNMTGGQMPIPCSIGIVIETAGKTEYKKLIQEADEAMYQAKGKGKNIYHIMMK